MDPLEIYDDLKQKIIWLDLDPGTTLNLEELAATYNVSRNPITLALTRLEVEEWVVRHGSHFVVSQLTIDRIREITEIRSVLEIQANVWALQRISPALLAQLKRLKEEILRLKDDTENRKIVELDVRFHRVIFKAARNQQMSDMLDHMLGHFLRFWLSSPKTINQKTFFRDAITIINSIETKDEKRLKAASAAHIKASLDEIMGLA